MEGLSHTKNNGQTGSRFIGIKNVQCSPIVVYIYLYGLPICIFILHYCIMSTGMLYVQRVVNWWFGLVLWIPKGSPKMKGIVTYSYP